MKIAVSSQNFRTITGHAGKGRRFMVYEFTINDVPVETGRLDLPKSMSMHEAPHGQPHPLDEMDVLITAGCGAGFIRKMQARNVQVVRTAETDPVTAVRAFRNGDLLPTVESVHDQVRHHGEHDHGSTALCGCGSSGSHM